MAAFLLVRDPDPERRRLGIASGVRAMEQFDLEVDSDTQGRISVAWGTFPGGPVFRAPGVFVMGDLVTESSADRMSVLQYLERTRAQGAPPPCDGFHYAATFDTHGALTVAVDLLGSFPLFYATIGEALVAASSPALIAAYPGFSVKPDTLGITALLVTNGGMRGRTLYRDIRRLAAGHALLAEPGGVPRESRQFDLEMTHESHDVPGEECAYRLHAALVEAAKRHVQNDVPHTMMLSGGLDSRIITGVLARQGVPLNLITRGAPDELEWKCARTVGRRLGLDHHRVPSSSQSFQNFERLLWWTGLACAPGTGGGGLGERVPHMRRHVVSGLAADPILGGLTASKPFDRSSHTMSTDRYVGVTNAWGVPLDRLPGLLRRDVFGDSLQTTLDELREDYLGAADSHMGRSWLHSMRSRQRFAVGGMWSRLTFAAWPKMPHLDRKVLRVAAGIPLPLLARRRLEHEMLERFHTDLARLPLDRNDLDTTPPLPGVLDLVRAGLDRRIRRLRTALGVPRAEQRHYFRTYDFNGPAWRATRQRAERDRERVYDLFEREAFDALVPRAEEQWTPTGTIEGSAAPKMLVAFGVWLRIAETGLAPSGTST